MHIKEEILGETRTNTKIQTNNQSKIPENLTKIREMPTLQQTIKTRTTYEHGKEVKGK